MNHSALWYFDHFGLLQGLSATQKQQVEEKTRMLHLKRGDAVYLPGGPTEHVCVVKTGAVKIVGTSPEGGAVNLAVLMPGDIFGELALTGEDTPQDDRAEAMEDTSLCEVPRDLMFRMIEETPAFGRHVTKLVGLRLRLSARASKSCWARVHPLAWRTPFWSSPSSMGSATAAAC